MFCPLCGEVFCVLRCAFLVVSRVPCCGDCFVLARFMLETKWRDGSICGRPLFAAPSTAAGEIVKLKYIDGLVETKVKKINSDKNK